MAVFRRHTASIIFVWLLVLGFAVACTVAAEVPRRGGVLSFVVPAEPPSFDAHRETTFAVIHPLAPFCSTLIRINPDNSADPTDFVGDVARAVPKPTDGGTTYTFSLRSAVLCASSRNGYSMKKRIPLCRSGGTGLCLIAPWCAAGRSVRVIT